jgi:uncharacterized membrane protein
MSDARPERAYRWVAAVLRWGSYLSAALMLAGVVLVFFLADVPIQVGSAMPLGTMLSSLRHANPYAVMQLGVVLLLLTPLARLVVAAVSFWLEGERRYAVVSLAVLVIILASLVLSRRS